MSSIKNQKIGGDASVGRNVAMGGNGRIAGSLIIGHNLQVKGWLEASNIKDTNKGVFATVEKLTSAYPSPRDGWFAGVGTSTPFDLYVAEGGRWVATSGELDVEVDLDYYNGEIDRIDGNIHDLTEDVSANSDAIEQHDGLIAGHTQQIAEITETLTEVQQTATAAKEQSEANAGNISEHGQQIDELSSTVSANSQSIAGHAQQIETISGTLAETRETADEAKNQSNANAVNISRVNALVGYYECSTPSDVSAKTITANSFSRIVGGCMHVKMHFANTASSVTLNINGTGAIALYYNGKHASARNTWEDDEIVVVFFDGDEYQTFPVGAKYIEQQLQPQPSQPADFPELDELEERVGSLERAAGQHNVLPFDGTLSFPSVTPSDTLYEHTIQPREGFEYSICLIPVLGSVRFCLKVGNDYYNNWSIKKQFSSDGLIPVGQGSIDDPYSVPSGTYTEEISNNDWYSGELHNKVFYNRSNKVVYAYNCETKSLEAMTNIQVVEENAPEAESDSNPNHATKGSIVVDLEHDKMLTWNGNKWKALSGGGSTPVDVPNSIAIRNRVLYLEKVSTGSEPVVFASVELPDGGGQTVLVQSNEDSPSIVRLDANTSKLGKKVIPLGTSAANLFKNGVRQNDSDVYNSTTYSSDDGTYTVYHIKYEFDLNGGSVTVPEKSILKFEGGCLKNGTLVGNNTKVEVDGTYTIFDSMSFSGTFRDSNLYATNFGAVSDMNSVDDSLTYKNLNNIDIKRRTGTDNLSQFKSIRDFACRSNNITIDVNGDFFLKPTKTTTVNGQGQSIVHDNQYYNKLVISDANNLTFKGGTTLAAWWFEDCNDVTLDGCSFVGLHECHIFPKIVVTPHISDTTGFKYDYGKQVDEVFDNAHITFINQLNNAEIYFGVLLGVYFTSASSYNPKPKAEQTMTYGNNETTITESEFPSGFTVRNCHFEMRSAGIYLGETGKASLKYKIVKDCIVENCTFDHISTQPISMHVRNAKFKDLAMNYVGIPFDLSSGSAYCTFENIKAEACGMGWKQDHADGLENLEGVPLFCGGNVVKNLQVTVDNTFPRVHATASSNTVNGVTYRYTAETDYFLIKIKQAVEGDRMYLEDCVFNVSKSEETLTLKQGGANWKYDVNYPTYTIGYPQLHAVMNSGSPAYFKNCKFNIDTANLFINQTYSNNGSKIISNVNTFEGCDINIYGRIVSHLLYAASANFIGCNIKYAGVGAQSTTECTFMFKGTVDNVKPKVSIKDSNLEINYGVDFRPSGDFEFVNNILLYKNPDRCFTLNYDNIKINGNTITCTLNSVDDSTASTMQVFMFNNSGALNSVQINNNRIISRSGYLIYINSSSCLSNFEFKYNDVSLTNTTNSVKGIIYENSGSPFFSKINNNQVYKNVFRGSSPYLIGKNALISTENGYRGASEINNTVLKDNIIGDSYKDNIDYYYHNTSSLTSLTNGTLKYINNRGELTTTVSGTTLSATDKGLVIAVYVNYVFSGYYVWTGTAWRRQENDKGTYAEAPFADQVEPGTKYFDITNNRLFISDGTQWNPININSSVAPGESDEPTVPAYGAAEDIPQTAQLGALYFDTTNDVMKVYNGSAWASSEQRVVPDSTGVINADFPRGYIINNTNTNTVQIKLSGEGVGSAWTGIPLDANNCLTVGIVVDELPTTKDSTIPKQIYYVTSEGKYYLWHPDTGQQNVYENKWYEITKEHIALSSGTFNNAPDINEVVKGYTYYDTVRQKLLTAKSEGWTDNDGNVITVLTKGTTAQRPAVTDITEGFKYYNTESHKEQIYNGTTWIDIEDAASTGIRIDSLVPDVVTGSALSTTLAADINKYYRYDTAVDDLTVTLPELASSSKVQNVVVYLTAGSNADSTTITFAAATPAEGVAAPVYYQKSYTIEAGKTYEINALYNGAAWIVAAVEIVTAAPQSSNASNNSLLMGGFTPLDNNSGNAETPNVEPDNTETV